MTLKRILLIAPDHPGLDWPVELEQVGSRHQVVALLGKVDQERITRATTGQRFDVVHVASHGSGEGIQLSENWMGMAEFAQMVRHVRADLVFLNACDSARLAQYLIDQGLRAVVAWTVAVVDGNAIRTASYFYDELAMVDDLRLAYNKVNPRDGALCFLAGNGYLEDVIRPVVEQLTHIDGEIIHLVGTVQTQGKALRYVVAAVIAGIVLALTLVVVGIVCAAPSDQTVPPATSLPGCDASGGQPKKCTPQAGPMGITDTPVPDTPEPTATLIVTVPPTALPTDTPTARPEGTRLTPAETPSEAPTATLTPILVVDTATPVATATALPVATATATPTGQATKREPTEAPTRAPTWTPTSPGQAVDSKTVTATATATKWPTVTPTLPGQTLKPCR